ncbi:MAG: hypothetical protein CMM61_11335 [Rhodospirillaceae bacterium]|nr:hypothetical protein [Rhodospirillaceae bacterium]
MRRLIAVLGFSLLLGPMPAAADHIVPHDAQAIARLADLNKAFVADPTNPRVLQRRAVLLTQIGRPHEAIADLDAAIAQTPDDWDNFILLGTIYESLNRWDDAAVAFARADRLLPTDAGILLMRAKNLIGRPSPTASQGMSGVEFAARSAAIRDSSEARAVLAAGFARAREYVLAVEEQRRALALSRTEGRPAQVIADYRADLSRLEALAEPARLAR